MEQTDRLPANVKRRLTGVNRCNIDLVRFVVLGMNTQCLCLNACIDVF